ncbi:MAG: HDOD domain-containing protein [Candidatus Latescibacteria bacterium]|jgi:putative nucleotidyltransferase with HDIG domain|nr:HDOD domain-containing protein [Candidatus Latescibacterota bacterium]
MFFNNIVTRETVKEALASHKLHPSVPDIVVEIINITQSPDATINDLVNVVNKDQELSEHIIHISKSGFHPKHEVESVSDAIILMGWNAIKMISLGSTILKKMSDKDKRLYSHSVRTAHIARFLAVEANFYKAEEIAVVGLLHDLGLIILAEYFNDIYLKTKQYSIDRGCPMHVAERKLLGVDHAEIGGWTVEEWNLPENIIESVTRHHSFDPDSYHAKKTAVIHIADILALATDYAGPPWEKVSELFPSALKVLGFSEMELRDLVLAIMKMKFDTLIF